jgi:uncharacterized protein (DUF58 family)
VPLPTRRLIALTAAGALPAVPAVAFGPVPWVALWAAALALLAVAAVVDLVRCPGPRRLAVEVHAPARVAVGEESRAEVRLRLDGAGQALSGTALADLSEHFEPVAPVGLPLSAERTVWPLPLVPVRRGPASLDRLWVRWSGPWGLMERTADRPLEVPVTVTPQVERAHGDALRFLAAERFHGDEVERFSGTGSEFEALRDWLPGVDPRAVDWKASARHQRLLAREYRAERSHQLLLALDTGRLMGEPAAGLPLLDHASRGALMLAQVALRRGDRVGLYTFAARPGALLPPRDDRGALHRLRRRLGELSYDHEETNYTLALSHLGARVRRRSLVVVFTDFVDSVTAELMVENLGRLARRHLVLFVALASPVLTAARDARPDRLLDVERALVADGLLRDRATTLARLKRQGVLVVDAPPREVGPSLLQRYLEVQRRERL